MLLCLSLLLFISYFTPIQSNLTKIVDLTWDFTNETIYWPNITPFTYTKKVGNEEERGFWYAANEFCAGEHGGTHFDAPYHFNKEGWKVGEVPVDRLVTNGALLDAGDAPQLLPSHLEEWVEENGQFENNTLLLVKFGRSKFWPNRTLYMGLDAEGQMRFPGLSAEAADWIVRSGRIVGVGVDTPSVDPGTSTDLMAHRILYKAQIYGVENVRILETLPAKGFTVMALPMKLKEGTGAPARVMAVPKVHF